jgi:cystathionine beta-lyase/cystathionine gamma-synthase
MDSETRLNHPPEAPVPEGNRPVVAPVYQSVKFEFDTVEATLANLRGAQPGYYYQRTSNPTLRQLELTLAQVQGREACLVCASGIAAIANTLVALTRAGDHVLVFAELYGPTRHLVRRTLARFGVTHTLLSVLDLAGIERTLAATPTRLIVFESPTNPLGRIADLAAICALARRHGALTVLDNTMAGIHQHGAFEIDLYIHSLTKYAAGHGDVMGGAVIGSSALIDRMRGDFRVLGGTLDPHAAFLVQRGLKTHAVRYREQSRTALALALWLKGQPQVARVYYPGLADDPGHALARTQMQEFGCVLSLDVAGGAAAAARFCESLQLFGMAASFGATESLALPPQLLLPGDLSGEERELSGAGPALVRLSIGLETEADLRADLAQALARA